MLKFETAKVFRGSDVFDACRKACGEDIEGAFCEQYCPPQEGAVWFNLPMEDEDFSDYNDVEQVMFSVLHHEGGLAWGEGCYIHFDF